MSGVQFNTCVSILFVGYVLMQIPSNMLITRIKPGIYMSGWMLVWAVVSACTALVQNFGGLVAARFFLGITEAPFYPGATYMLSIFYTRKGQYVTSKTRTSADRTLQRSQHASRCCTAHKF
jgi:MFS family permease